MKALQNKVNVTAPDATWLYGEINNNSGAGDGTPLDKEFTTDMAQFFERLIALSTLSPNGTPDNEANGWQLWDAFLEITHPRPYKVYTALISQSGTNAPTVTVLESELSGTVTFSYVGVGLYTADLTGEFTVSKTAVIPINVDPADEVLMFRANPNSIQIQTTTGGVLADDVLAITAGSLFEIRVYN